MAQALKAVLDKGDPSYFVEASALEAYSQLQQPDAVHVVSPWLEKSSYSEVLRTAALTGLGNSQDLGALDTLTEWTKRGKPRMCRSSALQALARLARTANPTDDQRKKMVQVISANLEGESEFVVFGAIGGLSSLGQSASSALPALNAVALHHPNERIRDQAKQVERLRKSQDDLQDRLNRFEKTKTGAKEAQTK